MRSLLVFAILLLIGGVKSKFVSNDPETFSKRLSHAKIILAEVPLIDSHNDLAMNLHDILNNQLRLFPFDRRLKSLEPWASDLFSHTDLPLLKEGMVAAQFWNAWVPCDSKRVDNVIHAVEQLDVIKRLIQKYPDDLEFVDSSRDILEAFAEGKIASLIGLEGGHMINSSLAVLRTFYHFGVRYLSLTHSCSTPWAETSSHKKNDVVGLTDFGKLVVGEMNRLGMLVDLSYASHDTMADVLEITAAPVLFSNNGASALCNTPRNIPDEILRNISDNGGIVMVNFNPLSLTCSPNASLYDVIDHINHIRKVSGVGSVGIGSNFNGFNTITEGLEDVSKYPYLFAEMLLDPNWSDDDLKKLAGLNFLRVFELVEVVRNELAYEAPIEHKFLHQ